MKINLENKQELGASTLRQITYMPYVNLKSSAVNTTYHCVLLSWNTRRHSIQDKPSNIDIIARTMNRKCVHRNSERHVYGQLSDSTSAQREWENQDQERSKTGEHHLTQAVHGNIGEHI